MSIRIAISALVASIVTTFSSAQYYYIPFRIPDHPDVNQINLGLDFGADTNQFYVAGRGLSFGADTSPGAVYQFDRNTYDFIQSYTPINHPWDDFFGWAMEYLDGSLFVSAIYAPNPTSTNGAVYIIDPFTGSLIHTFNEPTTDTPFGFYGSSMSVDDVNYFIGAQGYGPDQRGAVFVYVAANNIRIATLTPDPATPDTRYGNSVDHNTSYLAVSAPGYDLDNIEGAVYIYDYNTGGLLYRLTCPIPDTNGTSNFGNDILLVDDRLFVSVGDFAPFNIRGRIYVFDLTTGNHIDTLLPPDTGDIFARFGYSMSAEGNIGVFSCERDNSTVLNGGAVYIYNLDTLEVIDKVDTPMLNRNFMQFGMDVKIQDGTIFASAIDPRETDIQTNKRVVYILERFCRPDITLDGDLNFLDVSAFLKLRIDYNEDGSFNFLDISEFLAEYSAGCP